MIPIPRDARHGDSRWEREFLELAHGLVRAGAKTKLITRFTGLSLRKARSLYRALRNMPAPAGPILQGRAESFALQHSRASSAWSIQCAIFLACYEDIEDIAEQSLHRGWQLLAAFTTYIRLTDPLHRAASVRRLDINQAYALLTHCGFLTEPQAPLKLTECPSCLISYPIVVTVESKAQRCPVCSMSANSLRLARQGSRAARKEARVRP